MKVLLLNGSANKNGNTFYCIIDYPELYQMNQRQ